MSEFDPLTGLPWFGVFFRKWQALFDECRKRERNCGVLVIEVDDCYLIHEVHGAVTAKEVLKRVAQLLKRYESPACVVGRLGGMQGEGAGDREGREGFAVAISGADAEIMGAAEMIRRFVERMHGPVIERNGKASEHVRWKCTVSVGVASARPGQSGQSEFDAERLVKVAESALEAAKEKGGNQVQAC